MRDHTPEKMSRSASSLAAGVFAALVAVALACSGSVEEHLFEARAFQDAGDFENSIEPLREVLADAPDHEEANYRLGLALVRTRQPTLGVWPLRKASESGEYAEEAGLLLASTLLQTQGFEEAIEVADRSLERSPGNLEILLVRAQANQSIGAGEEALADVDAALAVDPDNERALAVRATVLAKLERFDEAELTLRRVEEVLRASGVAGMAVRGCVAVASFFVEHQPDRAEPEVARCLDEAPSDPLVLRVAASYYDQVREEPEKGDALYRDAIEDAPDELALRDQLASRLERRGALDEAEAVLVAAAELFDEAQPWDRLAQLRMQRGDLEKAAEANDRALELAGDGADQLRFRKADLLVEEERHDEAAKLAEQLPEVYRDTIRGKILFVKGEDEAALEAFEAGLLRWPNNAAARFLAGRVAERLGMEERAVSHYREAVRTERSAPTATTDAALHLAGLQLARGQWKEATEMAARQIESRPFVGPEPHAILVRALAAQNQMEAARAALTRLAEIEGMEQRSVVERIAVEQQASGAEAAVKVVEQSGLDLAAAENEAVLRLYVVNLLALGRIDEVERRVAAAVEANPEAAFGHDLRGRVLVEQGRGEEARAAFERALAAEPEYAATHAALASLAFHAGNLEEANRHVELALASDATNAEALFLRAEIFFRNGALEEGVAALRDVVAIAPSHVAACNNLAWLLAERDQELEFALSLAQRAVQLDRRPETLDTLGFVQLRSGNPSAALDTFERSLALRPDPSVRYRLGLAQDALGRTGDALASFQEALAAGSFPEAEQAQAQVARLDAEGIEARQ